MVCYDDLRSAVSFHGFLQKRKCGLLITGFGDVAFQHFAFMVDGAPEVMLDAIDLHENLVEVPLPLGVQAHARGALRSDLSGEDRSKSIHPEPHAFMAYVDPAFMKQVFDVPQRERKPDIHHHCELDDLRRCFEITKRILAHSNRLNRFKPAGQGHFR